MITLCHTLLKTFRKISIGNNSVAEQDVSPISKSKHETQNLIVKKSGNTTDINVDDNKVTRDQSNDLSPVSGGDNSTEGHVE